MASANNSLYSAIEYRASSPARSAPATPAPKNSRPASSICRFSSSGRPRIAQRRTPHLTPKTFPRSIPSSTARMTSRIVSPSAVDWAGANRVSIYRTFSAAACLRIWYPASSSPARSWRQRRGRSNFFRHSARSWQSGSTIISRSSTDSPNRLSR